MSVTTAQLTDKNNSPNAIKICRKEESSDYTDTLTFLSMKMKAVSLTVPISTSCCTYPSLYELNYVYAYNHYVHLKYGKRNQGRYVSCVYVVCVANTHLKSQREKYRSSLINKLYGLNC